MAPEFFQPLRDLGTFYHAKAQAVGGADALERFLTESPDNTVSNGTATVAFDTPVTLQARDLVVMTAQGGALSQPLNFTFGCRQAGSADWPKWCGENGF